MEVDGMHSSFHTAQGHDTEGKQEDCLEDEISELFFGKEVEFKSFTDARTNETIVKKTVASFGCTLLTLVDQTDLYSAWETDKRSTIDDYEYTIGQQRVKATVSQYVEKMPPILIMQMNRTKFDKGNQEKLLHTVPILQKFYPQRFMLKNRDDVEKRRDNVKVIRDKLKLLNDNLMMFRNKDGEQSLDIVKVLA
jgi:hypothetical protein